MQKVIVQVWGSISGGLARGLQNSAASGTKPGSNKVDCVFIWNLSQDSREVILRVEEC